MRTALILSATLAACAGAGVRDDAPDGTTEKAVYQAMRQAQASDPQRVQLLGAYDAYAAEIRRLRTERAELRASWDALDRRAADFQQRAAALEPRWGELAAAELAAESRFEQAVAAALEPAQWERWREELRDQQLRRAQARR